MESQIYLIESSSRQNLAVTFMRFQEYYESPEFKGRVFSVEDFAHWYALKFGSFSYSRDWYGFNIPGTVLTPFKNGDFNPLTPYEQKLIDFCSSVDGDSYIIGATSSVEYFKETVQHEFVHGVFYTNPEYRKEIIGCIRDFNIEPVYKGLVKMGYCDDVLVDETNAYILVEPNTIQEYSSVGSTKKLREQLDKIFKKFFGFSVLKTEISALLARTKHILI
jgi:hypothetical protein